MPSFRQTKLVELVKYYLRRLNVGQIIIGVCILALSIWCGYNVRLICHKYFEFETIISLENSPPSTTGFPGITICAPSIFKPQKLAGKLLQIYR